MYNKIIEKVTVLYLRFGFGKFIKKIEYTYKNSRNTVYLFSSKSEKGAHCTPFNTILMQDILFKKYSKLFRDYVFLHESGHIKMNYFIQILFYLIAIPAVFLFFAIIPFIFLVPLFLLHFGFSIEFAFIAFITYLAIFLILNLIILVTNWYVEGYAELFAIKVLGEKKYLLCYKEQKQKAKKRIFFKRYFYRLIYPPKKLIVWINHHRTLDK